MNAERPAPEDIPGSDGIQVKRQPVPGDLRQINGTGQCADQQQLGITDEEVDDLEDDAEGG